VIHLSGCQDLSRRLPVILCYVLSFDLIHKAVINLDQQRLTFPFPFVHHQPRALSFDRDPRENNSLSERNMG
jgi:hypothetical protein